MPPNPYRATVNDCFPPRVREIGDVERKIVFYSTISSGLRLAIEKQQRMGACVSGWTKRSPTKFPYPSLPKGARKFRATANNCFSPAFRGIGDTERKIVFYRPISIGLGLATDKQRRMGVYNAGYLKGSELTDHGPPRGGSKKKTRKGEHTQRR